MVETNPSQRFHPTLPRIRIAQLLSGSKKLQAASKLSINLVYCIRIVETEGLDEGLRSLHTPTISSHVLTFSVLLEFSCPILIPQHT